MNIAHILKSWRGYQGYSIRQACAMVGISRSAWQRIETGKPLDQDNLCKVLKWLLSD